MSSKLDPAVSSALLLRGAVRLMGIPRGSQEAPRTLVQAQSPLEGAMQARCQARRSHHDDDAAPAARRFGRAHPLS